MPLKRMAKPLPDRAPTVDPAKEASAELAVRAPMPNRSRPVPFTPVNIPDPFERWEAARFGKALPEEPMPVTRLLTPPRKR